MKRDTPWRLLLGTQLFVTAGVASFRWGLAPALTNTYRDAAIDLSLPTRVALTSELPLGLVTLCTIVALASALGQRKRSRRLRVLSVVLTISGLTFVLTVVASVWPFTQV